MSILGAPQNVAATPVAPQQLNRAYVTIDERFDVAIDRALHGLEIRVYPRTDGEIWCDPYDTFNVDGSAVLALEKEMEV